jgi:hypothetical protein
MVKTAFREESMSRTLGFELFRDLKYGHTSVEIDEQCGRSLSNGNDSRSASCGESTS